MTKLYLTAQIKDIRSDKGYTQENMAQVLALATDKELAAVTYRKWETGENPVAPLFVLEIAKIFNLATSEVCERR